MVVRDQVPGKPGHLPLTYMLRLLQDPWLALPWSLTDTAVVAAFTLGAALSARLLFR